MISSSGVFGNYQGDRGVKWQGLEDGQHEISRMKDFVWGLAS